ncbi:MAG: hypothetical protein RI900_2561, partial [Actinomycetota bacterium]
MATATTVVVAAAVTADRRTGMGPIRVGVVGAGGRMGATV